jgi:hypothetical protein
MKKGQVTGEATANPAGLDQVTLSTWQNNCVSCHGRIGAGDGPQAPLYQPRDLTDPAFQSAVSDEQLLTSIQQGKGKMPGFSLPEATARGLVRLIRLLARSDGRSAGSPSAAPAVSTADSTVAGAAPPHRSTPPAAARSGAAREASGAADRKVAPAPGVAPRPTTE